MTDKSPLTETFYVVRRSDGLYWWMNGTFGEFGGCNRFDADEDAVDVALKNWNKRNKNEPLTADDLERVGITATYRLTSRWTTAYHEAGHALLGLHFNFPLSHVTILPNPKNGSDGQTFFHEYYVDEENFFGFAVMMYGGYAASTLFRPNDSHDFGCENDFAGVENRMWLANKAITGPCWIETATELLKQKWPAVESVAAALLKHNTLSRKQILKCVKAAT